jgi:hypothetical protein
MRSRILAGYKIRGCSRSDSTRSLVGFDVVGSLLLVSLLQDRTKKVTILIDHSPIQFLLAGVLLQAIRQVGFLIAHCDVHSHVVVYSTNWMNTY